MGNPVISFHLENLLYRFKFVLSAFNSDINNNYEFWNTRSLRQYVIYLVKFNVFNSIIQPYLSTIGKNVKKYDLLDELSSMISLDDFNCAIKSLLSENNHSSKAMRDKLMEKLVQVST